jgi:hypothetical protein
VSSSSGGTIHVAKTHLSRSIARAEAGEEIVIARGRKPVAKRYLSLQCTEDALSLSGRSVPADIGSFIVWTLA